MCKYRVWHIPQIPMKPFHVNVDSLQEAKFLIDTLAQYDLFQYENNIKPDYGNASGLEVIGYNREWKEWHSDEDEGIDFYTWLELGEMES